MLEAILKEADPKTRAAIGRYLQQLADQLLAAADSEDALTMELERRRAVNERYRALAPLLTRLVLHGKAPDAAADLVAQRFRLEAVRLAAWWRSIEGRRAVRALRDKRVIRNAAAGRHDAEIAARFGLSSAHVNRVVRRAVRSGSWRQQSKIGGAL
jgi:hypothetical protein